MLKFFPVIYWRLLTTLQIIEEHESQNLMRQMAKERNYSRLRLFRSFIFWYFSHISRQQPTKRFCSFNFVTNLLVKFARVSFLMLLFSSRGWSSSVSAKYLPDIAKDSYNKLSRDDDGSWNEMTMMGWHKVQSQGEESLEL